MACRFGWKCICATCPRYDKCEDQPRICRDCTGEPNDVMLFCSDGVAHGAQRGEVKRVAETT